MTSRVSIPKALPSYVDEDDISKLIKTFKNKQSHKGSIERDLLLMELALKSGMRRGKLANLADGDIHADFRR